MFNYSTMKEDVNRQLKFIETGTVPANETDTVPMLVSPLRKNIFENLLLDFYLINFWHGAGVRVPEW
jgi:hypothetical protein